MMKLYYAPGACSRAVHIIARETGTAIQLVRVDLGKKTLPDGSDYRRLNPKGYVPMLEFPDGSRLTEVPALLVYLADMAGSTSLFPDIAQTGRYHVLEWLAYISSELHHGHGPLFKPGSSDEMKAKARQTLMQRYELVAATLAQQDYLTGDSFRLPDAFLYVILSWAPSSGLDLSGWPQLAAFSQRIAARPAVQAAQQAEDAPT